MCDELPAGDVALGEIGGALEGLVGFVLKNAVPCALAALADVALVFTVQHLVLVVSCTVVALVVSTLGRVLLARWLLAVMGTLAVPVGLDKLNPQKAAKKRVAITAAAQKAIGNRVPIAIGMPVKVVPGRVVSAPAAEDEPAASVVINGTTYSTLRK